MSVISQLRNSTEYMMYNLYANQVPDSDIIDIKSIDDLSREISETFCPSIAPEVFKSCLLDEIKERIDGVVMEIDDFLASNPTQKNEIRKFRNYRLHASLAYILHEWAKDGGTFEFAVVLTVLEHMGTYASIQALTHEDSEKLHNAIYPGFVQPSYNQILSIWQESIEQDDRLFTSVGQLLDGIWDTRDKLIRIVSI